MNYDKIISRLRIISSLMEVRAQEAEYKQEFGEDSGLMGILDIKLNEFKQGYILWKYFWVLPIKGSGVLPPRVENTLVRKNYKYFGDVIYAPKHELENIYGFAKASLEHLDRVLNKLNLSRNSRMGDTHKENYYSMRNAIEQETPSFDTLERWATLRNILLHR